MAKRLRYLNPDLIHTNSLKAHVYGTLAARLVRRPVVWHLHDRLSEDYLPSAAISLVHRLESHASVVIANSEVTRATLRQPGRAVVIPPPVSPPFFDVRVSYERAYPVIGLVGRIAPWKGQLEFVRAFSAAFPSGGARARIIGAATFRNDEDYLRLVEDELLRLGLGDRISLCGYQDDVAEQLSELSLLVHTSTIPEPFGLVAAEAMAAGLPVIASSRGAPAEMITHRRNGLLVDPTDVQALASAMKELVRDSALRRTLGTAARSSAHAYAARTLADRYLVVYSTMVAVRDRGDTRVTPRDEVGTSCASRDCEAPAKSSIPCAEHSPGRARSVRFPRANSTYPNVRRLLGCGRSSGIARLL